MKPKKRNGLFIGLSLLISVWLVIAQVLASNALILPCIICFALLTAYAAFKDMAVPVLLYFLPWSPLLKLSPGTISMYTVALVLVLLVYIIRSSKRFRFMHLFPALFLLIQSVIIKTVTNASIDNSFLLFFVCLMLFPQLTNEIDKNYDFYTLFCFFSLGIITAALSAQQVMIFPTISRYIVVHSYQDLTRLSGFYSDPNFYSAHISAVISGALLLLPNEKKAGRVITLFVWLIVLLYCGFLSISKSFFLVALCILLLWVVDILFKRGKISDKIMLLTAIMIGMLFIVSSLLFTDLLDMIIERFIGSNKNLSDFTTGRTDLWMSYFRAFDEEPLTLIFGKGMTDKLVNDRASHNIIIQSLYQFGIIGSTMLVIWFAIYLKTILNNIRLKSDIFMPIMILAVGVFGPWMALDSLFFDEFFLLPLFFCLGIMYISGKTNGKSTQLPDGDAGVVKDEG